jgi:putative addiction module component (TIGR02574 family)
MESKIVELEKELLRLPIQERAFLAKKLISSLDEEEEEKEDPNLEHKWIIEAQRRYNDYKLGKTPAKDADQAIKDARSKLS